MNETADERELARQLATLTLSGLPSTGPSGALQAVAWRNGVAALGLGLPLFVVHDLGHLLARPALRALARERPRDGGDTPQARYRTLVQTLAHSESLAALGTIFVRDEVIAVLIARLLGDPAARWAAGPGRALDQRTPLPLVSALFETAPGALARAFDCSWAQTLLPILLDGEPALRARVEQVDLGPVRLLGLFGAGGGPLDLAELHRMMSTRGIADAVDFCLQLLPSLLETKRQGAPQSFAVDGYASVERRGSADALLPSELAHDGEIFDLRALSDELLYYGHERPREGDRRIHGVLVDASASMRGTREVFARGLALALVKTMALQGVDVWFRFFDGRLHGKVPAASLGGQELPYVLCFQSEQGRHYARVFQDLLLELGRGTGPLSLTVITHGECHIPTATVEALARRAALHVVYVLPSAPLALDYLPLLARHDVVTAESLADKRRQALEIIDRVGTHLNRVGTRRA